ncbi:methyltransferase domain-containing protein [Massilia sp. B-10]|nr:methyltransferase domain-containing protein [Massilia sp. B-10]
MEISRQLARLSDEKLQPLGGRCIHASAQDGILRFDENYFDIIVMASFLEHESNPLAVLENCRKRLKPNGTIIVKVPNFACYNRMLRGALERLPLARSRQLLHPRHLARHCLSKAGLDITRMGVLDRTPFSDSMYALMRVAA